MQLLVHASECRDPHCVSSNCRKIKEMFMHAHSCKVKVTGGCQLCRWARTAVGCCGSLRIPVSNLALVRATRSDLLPFGPWCGIWRAAGSAPSVVCSCRRMWALLQLHAKQCTVADCPVLRCRELRQMRRLQMARQEEKRRVAYKNMLRNQARRV